MDLIKTYRDLFLILKDAKINFKNGASAIKKVKEIANTNYLGLEAEKKIKNFCAKLYMKWCKSCRIQSRFFDQNQNWLNQPLELSIIHSKGIILYTIFYTGCITTN